MIYLIGQLSIWLFLTAVCAAIAGWAFAAERAAPAERSLRRDRDNLMRDLIRLASGEDGGANPVETERETDVTRRLLQIRDARIAELEQAAETARGKANDAAAEIAELQRRVEQGGGDSSERIRLRALAAEREREADAVIETTATVAPSVDEEAIALQAWRLRYFEQRVRYLEGLARAAIAPQSAPAEPDLALQWRARDAEARAAHLEEELRAQSAPQALVDQAAPSADVEPFAADADVDVLLRWRLLYLERRVAYLQEELAEEEGVPLVVTPAPAAPDPDRWKWRARYLEARVRHLEQRAAPAEPAAQVAALQPVADIAPSAPPAKRAKPPVLASARNGAPDDFTLIDGVSVLQQSTLYSLGVFHFDQIAAWTAEHVAWVDHYLRLGGRIADEEWVEQADDLAREGPAAARRVLDSEDL